MRILFHAQAMAGLAQKICEPGGIALGEIDWESFEDDSPNMFIRDVHRVRRADVIYLASMQNGVSRERYVIRSLIRYLAKSMTIILPYFPYGTMDRVDIPGQVATAKSLADDLSHFPHCARGGPPLVVTYDIHSLQERFYPEGSVGVDLQSAMPILRKKLKRLRAAGHKVAVAWPDEGAMKRFGHDFPDYEQIVCEKRRVGNDRIITIKEGDPTGCYVVIVDDLIKTGKTTLRCREALIARGALKVSVFVTHGVFPRKSWQQFTPDLFDKVWITDSCPVSAAAVAGIAPFEVESLANPIRGIIFEWNPSE